jgi:hypothetical protein
MTKIINIHNKRRKNNKYQQYRASLDKNNDGFISIDEYLSDIESKGPDEDKGQINYNHMNIHNSFLYFISLITHDNKFKILCVPDVTVFVNNFNYKSSIVYIVDDNKLILSSKLSERIKMCSNRENIRFILMSITLLFKTKIDSEELLGHANVGIIDLHKKTFERFEPHGKYTYIEDVVNHKPRNYDFDEIFEKKINKHIGLDEYTYIPAKSISPLFGIQSKADAHGGLCVSISMLYLHLRILNPDIPQQKIVNKLIKMERTKLLSLILRYIKHIEIQLKKYPNMYEEMIYYVVEDYMNFKKYNDIKSISL